MRILMTAIALVIASPAVAQTAPAQQHQGHDQHQQHGQQQGQAQHGQHQQGQHQERSGCCADRNGNGRMDCCEGMAQAGDRRGCCPEQAPTPAPAAQPQSN